MLKSTASLVDGYFSPRFWEVTQDIVDLLGQPVATLGAGLIVGVGAWLGFKASRESRLSTERLAEKTDNREKEAARHDRYTRIAEQLASEKTSIQLSGVYSLSALSDDWHATGNDALRDSCIDLLCAYLRGLRDPEHDGEDELCTTIMSIIEKHTEEDDDDKWDAMNINLSGAHVYGCRLFLSDLSYANLSYTRMIHADFEETSFRATLLTEAVLRYGNFKNVDFDTANLIGIDAEKSAWADVILRNAKLTSACLEGAKFERVHFLGADLRNACLAGADLSGAHFEGADLSEADFGERGVNEAQFWAPQASATWDEETKWPTGFRIEEVLTRQAFERGGGPR